nr:EOG090X0F7H [Macrothrix elegans]
MESIEVVPSANLIKFFGEIEISRILKADGIISGFRESPLNIDTVASDIQIKVDSELEPEINIGQDRVQFLNVDSFEMFEPKSSPKTTGFSTTFPNFGLPKGVQSLHIKKATANRVTSKLNGTLVMRSDKTVRLKGNEGVNVQGKEIFFRADQDLLLRSVNGSVILSAVDGVILDIESMGGRVSGREEETKKRIAEYKLCICMPSGQLFRIPVLEGTDAIHCDSIDLTSDDNPCA